MDAVVYIDARDTPPRDDQRKPTRPERLLGGDDGLRVLVPIGLRDDGVKDLLAVGDGCRASTESWSGAMCDLRDRAQRAVPGDR